VKICPVGGELFHVDGRMDREKGGQMWRSFPKIC